MKVNVNLEVWSALDEGGHPDGTFDEAKALEAMGRVLEAHFDRGDVPVLFGIALERGAHRETLRSLLAARRSGP